MLCPSLSLSSLTFLGCPDLWGKGDIIKKDNTKLSDRLSWRRTFEALLGKIGLDGKLIELKTQKWAVGKF